MDKHVSTFFKEFEDEVVAYRKHVDSVMQKYAKDKQEAIDTLKEKHLKPRLDSLKNAASTDIECEYVKLHHDWFDCYDDLLRKAIWAHVKQEPPKAAMDRLRLYNDFNIPMSKTDASYFLHELAGTYAGSLALSAVAAKSGLTIKVPDISQYEKEIEEIGQRVGHLSRYCPDGYWKDFAELDIEITNIDSTAFDPNRPSHCSISRVQNDAFLPRLQSIAQHWNTNFIPDLVDDEEMKEEERAQAEQEHEEALKAAADQIEIGDNADVELGRAYGKQKTESTKNAQEIVRAYASGAPGTGGAR